MGSPFMEMAVTTAWLRKDPATEQTVIMAAEGQESS